MAETTYLVTIGERTLAVRVRDADGSTFVAVDGGVERAVGLTEVRGVLATLQLDGRSTELMVDRSADGARVALDGVGYEATGVDEARARLASLTGGRKAAAAHADLKAPMPGLVLRVLCAPGDVVEADQPLVVLQAMKMENELSLPRGGTVRVVPVTEGQTVDKGALLVEIE